jgi:hypothetical protein
MSEYGGRRTFAGAMAWAPEVGDADVDTLM